MSDSTRSNTLESEPNLAKSIDEENETLEANKISKIILIDVGLEDEWSLYVYTIATNNNLEDPTTYKEVINSRNSRE